MMSEKLAVREVDSLKEWETNVGRLLTNDTIRQYLCPDATEEELFLFVQLCKNFHFNPFTRDAYLIKYKADSPASMVVGKDAYFKRADKFPQYDGLKSGIITVLGSKRNYQEGCMVFAGETLVGAWAEAYRKDRKIPFRTEVSMAEYEGKKYNWKTRQFEVNSMWKSKPATMITKVAEVQALRKAFPQLAGMYIAEEMEIGEETLPREPINLDTIKEPKRKVIDVGQECKPETFTESPGTFTATPKTFTENEPNAPEKVVSESETVTEPEPEKPEVQEKSEQSTAGLQNEPEDKPAGKPTDFRMKQITSLIASLPAESDEDRADFVKLLQIKVGIPEDKKMAELTQEEAVKMVDILKKQVSENEQDTPPEEPPDEPPAEPPAEEPKPKSKPAAKKSTAKKSGGGNVCSEDGCGKFVSKKVAEFSKKKYGRIVCFTCQDKLKGEA
jgi:phage recombination protein Bet